MDPSLDTSWCPVCDRQIIPKRFSVPVHPQPSPAPPPSSPSSSPSHSPSKNHAADAPTMRATKKGGNVRQRGGLVQGTGRLKPNGTIKRTDKPATAPITTEPTKPTTPLRHRTVIDQSPIPLYCSDECRLKDLQADTYDDGYHPDRHLPPVPRTSFSDSDSSTSTTSSRSRYSSLSSDSPSKSSSTEDCTASLPKHIATLCAIYNFPPIPPAPPVVSHVEATSSDSEYPSHYDSGIMMAARRIKDVLCPTSKRVPASHQDVLARERERKPITGWTDGSDAWRSEVYSFSAPKDFTVQDPKFIDDKGSRAYHSFTASPHRSKGIHSTVNDPTPVASSADLPQRSNTSSDELYSKYPLSFSRRSDSRTSLVSTASAPAQYHSLPTSSASFTSSSTRRREVRLVKPGAEGKLLVPNVKMVSRSPPESTYSFSSNEGSSYYPASSRRSVGSIPSIRSPLSRNASEIGSLCSVEENDERFSSSFPEPKRPSVETRSWSYDNFVTYPAMPLPTKKVKRKVVVVEDGEEKEVEQEVEVTEMKRLFRFAEKPLRA
ncbi:hypothetical protein JAAARDRAFT_44845 [Jaapia argillacea MUCL 33604]|uniref:Uncharacterized protein n=1 Tax=Jaapia argillacea MUCL 33604 TaxID=933084 RepID=A0A067Q8N1_9AGAM|nr:hypothetical protein JAAARDRAFT_44845 [Jaapia argillacea MUCL 33604]